jgi:hypothetical protein
MAQTKWKKTKKTKAAVVPLSLPLPAVPLGPSIVSVVADGSQLQDNPTTMLHTDSTEHRPLKKAKKRTYCLFCNYNISFNN